MDKHQTNVIKMELDIISDIIILVGEKFPGIGNDNKLNIALNIYKNI